MDDREVLIVGAGPTGLALGLFLAQNGVRFRIIDKTSGPGQQSRAMVVQARTLEFYRQLGFAEDVVARGIKMKAAHLREGNREVTQIKFGDFGEGLSPYPFILSFPQDDHERLLGERLKAAGVDVEWGAELTGFSDKGDYVRATVRHHGTDADQTYDYICGCDGAHSVVRQALHMGFAGGTYDQKFFVADVEASGEAAVNDGFSMCIHAREFCLIFPIRSTGMHRIIGIVPDSQNSRDDLSFEDLRAYVEQLVGIHIEGVNWFSLYHVHHRIADQFRVGRAFLLGDAGHIHSPAGGQGMNTGIGDAVNLAWKIAAVVQRRANASLLESYESERIGFARSLVATTDRAFQLMIGRNPASQLVRDALVPYLTPFLFGFSGVREAAFRLISQTRISYRESMLSTGAVGEVHGGDRLPWVDFGGGADNFAPLASLDWQVHVYGEAQSVLRDAVERRKLTLHEFAWTDATHAAGLSRDAVYLVRPDGYVALVEQRQEVEPLERYLDRFAIAARTV